MFERELRSELWWHTSEGRIRFIWNLDGQTRVLRSTLWKIIEWAWSVGHRTERDDIVTFIHTKRNQVFSDAWYSYTLRELQWLAIRADAYRLYDRRKR